MCSCAFLPECFSFLQPWRRKEKPAYELPTLQDACARARRKPCTLGLRSLAVCSRLTPVGCCVLGDLLRRDGPKNGVKNARRLRIQLEKLGPAFIKLGQCLAAREDVLSSEVAAELRKLCDQIVPISLEEARCLLEEELGTTAPRLQGDAVAAASLGQVYRIRIGGEEFAVKIQRPGLVDKLSVDVAILLKTASVSRRIYAWFARSTVDFVDVVRAWAETLWQELDYDLEARNMESMREQLHARVPELIVPRVCWSLSARRVLTTEWINGFRMTESLDILTPRLISVGVEAFAAMVLDMGQVHADPHAGNIIITHQGQVCLLDFGMVVEVPMPHRMAWARALHSMVCKDHERTLDHLISLGFFPNDCPREDILRVMPKIWTELVDCGSDIKKRKVAVQECFGELLTLVREFEFDLPDYYLALARAMITLEGIAIAADVEFDIFKAAMPPVLRFLAKEGKREAISACRRFTSSTLDAASSICPHRKNTSQVSSSYMYGLLVVVAGLGAIPFLRVSSI